MNIRALAESDINNCIGIINKGFDDIYSDRISNEILFKEKDYYKVVEVNGSIVGIAGYCLSNFTYNCYELFCVCIDPDFQRKKYGTNLINAIIGEIKSKEIEKDIYNEKDHACIILTCKSDKVSFYEKFGFKVCYNQANKYFMILEII